MKITIKKDNIDIDLHVQFRIDTFILTLSGTFWHKPRLGVYCYVEFPNYKGSVQYASSEAYCAPLDKFNKARGRTLALSRAIALLKFLNHEDRKNIFDALSEKGLKLG